MSRITGTDALNMMEAYNAVYVSHEEVELTEEQVQEDFENWVNSLVEEGHDLSEYTWEDMYEEYLNELTAFDAGGGKAKVQQLMRQGIGGIEANRRVSATGEYLQRQSAKPQPSLPGLTIGRGGFNINGKPVQPGMSPIFQRPGANPARPAAQAPSRPASTPTRPAATPVRPVAQAPARPAVTSTPKPTATTTPAATPATPRQRDTSITDMIGRSQIRQGAPINTGNVTSDIRSRALRGTDIGGSGGPAVKPSLQQQIRQRRLNMDLDLFDIVQGYLIDEGYAETEEAAAVIMANMSEEWKESILESGYFPTKESQMKDEAKHNLRGQAVKPRTAQTQSPKPSR